MTQYILQETVSSIDAVEYRSDLLNFVMRVENPGSLGSPAIPKAGNVVRWLDGATKEFEGQITRKSKTKITKITPSNTFKFRPVRRLKAS